jgi:endoglucanase
MSNPARKDAGSTSFTFENASVFTLTLNSATPSGSYAAALPPGSEQIVDVPIGGSGVNLNYFLNAPSASNFNLNLQNQSGTVQYSATQVPGTTQTPATNGLTLSGGAPALTVQQYSTIPFRGVNLSGAEAGSSYLPAWLPSTADAVYFVQQGMNTVRLPILWAFVTPTAASTTLSQPYAESIVAAAGQLLAAGLNVVLDNHSYMRFGVPAGSGPVQTATTVGASWALLAQAFGTLAKQYDGQSTKNQLLLEIMNEPNNMATEQVLENSNAALAAIRAAGLKNLVLIDGNSWTGLHSWTQVTGDESDGKSNAEVMIPKNIVDPANNYALVVHQYTDSNFSGTSPTCLPQSSFVSGLGMNAFLAWVKANDVKVFLSEFGSGSGLDCIDDITYLLSQVQANPYQPGSGGFIGWTAWVAGHGWSTSNFNNLTPNPDPTPQMTQAYAKFLTPPS